MKATGTQARGGAQVSRGRDAAATRRNDARQQEGFKGTFPDVREQEIRMGQMAMGGAVGINNRGAMPPTPVPAGTPAPPGPATMMPDGTLGLVINCKDLQ